MSDQPQLPMEDPGGKWAGHVDVPEDRWPSILAETVDVLVADWERSGVDREEAIARAQRTVLLIADYLGGKSVYWPRGDRLQQALRDRQIYLLHNGRNTHELADRFGLTVRTVERVYAEQRALQVRKRQGRLFGDD